MNISLAADILRLLAEWGVQEVCLCAGRRNAPFVLLLEKQRGLKVYSFFEERSAAFFALGCSKRSGRPTALFTTSGTACAELFPAIIEAWYSGIPLIAVTSDRPRRLRGSGAPQTIEQQNLFGAYVSGCFDVAPHEDLKSIILSAHAPLHINACFDEPVVDAEIPQLELAVQTPGPVLPEQPSALLQDFLASTRLPLVIVGPLRSTDVKAVRNFLSMLSAPALLESSSQLRGDLALQHCELKAGNSLASQLVKDQTCDAVLRIGGVPTARVWRDLDEKLHQVPVLSISQVPFRGLERGQLLCGTICDTIQSVKPHSFKSATVSAIHSADTQKAESVTQLFKAEPKAELSLVQALSMRIPEGSRVYLGNSLPVREWDLAAVREGKRFDIEVNRGANGIDGQLSTFLGWARSDQENWAIVGDLTAMYDLVAPWIVKELPDLKLRIVVINNGGGQIFSRMFSSELFLNSHQIDLAPWAALWKFDYRRWNAIGTEELPDRVIIELRPDAAASQRVWKEIDN